MSTVALPERKGDDGKWAGGGIGHVCRSPSTAAGIPPIITVGTPGPVTTPPWLVGSPTLAAAAMFFLINLHNRSFDDSIAAA